MRPIQRDAFSEVQVAITLKVPQSDPLHFRERINSDEYNRLISITALVRAFDDSNPEYEIVGARRLKFNRELDSTPAGESPVTEHSDTTADPEDHSADSAGDPDPSDDADTESSPAARWDFVVA